MSFTPPPPPPLSALVGAARPLGLRWGLFPEALALHSALWGKSCLSPRFGFLRGPLCPGEGPLGCRPQGGCLILGGLAHEPPLRHAASLSNSTSVSFCKNSPHPVGPYTYSAWSQRDALSEGEAWGPLNTLFFFQWFSPLSEAALGSD
uniref:Uncharacterized protein n=1 Tax=Pipistrellus kuhlii TaxID=59472 RepID=A0A7J7UTS4_PIPKU|nr:hypothetical protein mPipKuh1_008692 [Pipistrellus kuhlii]